MQIKIEQLTGRPRRIPTECGRLSRMYLDLGACANEVEEGNLSIGSVRNPGGQRHWACEVGHYIRCLSWTSLLPED